MKHLISFIFCTTLTVQVHGQCTALTEGSDNYTGTAGIDNICGLGGNDFIFLQEGNDIANGNMGNDHIRGGLGNDNIRGGRGDDELWGDEGNDLLFGDKENDTYFYRPGHGTDIIEDSDGLNTINIQTVSAIVSHSSSGSDRIYTINGGGNYNGQITIRNYNSSLWNIVIDYDCPLSPPQDVITKGSHLNDTYNLDDRDHKVCGHLGDDEINTGSGSDDIEGSYGNDIIRSGDGNDQINGNMDNDYIDAGPGNDHVRGGQGNDLILLTAGNDQLFGDKGNDEYHMYIDNGEDVIEDNNGANKLIIYNIDIDHINYYTSGNDGIFEVINIPGHYGKVTIKDFLLYWNLGQVEYRQLCNGNLNLPEYHGSSLNDDIDLFGEVGPYEVCAHTGDDRIMASQGNDFVQGNKGNDHVNGGPGNDMVRGGLDNDVVFGGKGDDEVYGDLGNDTVAGHKGNDFVYTGAGNDVVVYRLGDGNDQLFGEDFNTLVLEQILPSCTTQTQIGNDLYINIDAGQNSGQLIIHDYSPGNWNIITANKPNIIIVFADDLGYGDIEINGQSFIETPNINQLAAEGTMFSSFYSGAPSCPPARSSLMQGLHTGHTYVRIGEPFTNSIEILPAIMQNNGYQTSMFGKWGMSQFDQPGDVTPSDGNPLLMGFDKFTGFLKHRDAHVYFHDSPDDIGQSTPEQPYHEDIRQYIYTTSNDQLVTLDYNDPNRYLHEAFMEEALTHIENTPEAPQFIYLPFTLPHAELIVPEDEPLLAYYKQKLINEGIDEVTYPGGDDMFYKRKNDHVKATYATMVAILDRSIGQIKSKLIEQGLDKNTILIFTSDNGPHSASGYMAHFFESSGGLRDSKFTLYEGGIRVPFIAWGPDNIQSNVVIDEPAVLYDLKPTILDLAGIPSSDTDGLTLSGLFSGDHSELPERFLYWESSRGQALRQGVWKAVRTGVNSSSDHVELFNLEEDPQEANDLSVCPNYCAILNNFKNILNNEHEDFNSSIITPLQMTNCENLAPTESPVPDLDSLPHLYDTCDIVLNPVPTAKSYCGSVIMGETLSGPEFSFGNHTIEWTYTDAFGNTSTQLQQITLVYPEGDFNQNGEVDIDDFLNFVGLFNDNCTCSEDLNNDGIVNVDDFLLFLGNFGNSCY